MSVPNWQDFEVNSEAGHLVQPCLTFELYLWETAAGPLMDFYQKGLELLDGHVAFYNKGKRPAAFKGRATSTVPTWLENPKANQDFYFQLTSEKEGASAATLTLRVKRREEGAMPEAQRTQRAATWNMLYGKQGARITPPLSWVKITLPVDHSLAEGDAFAAWIRDLEVVRALPFLTGFAGFALNAYHWAGSGPLQSEVWHKVSAFCLRHPGFDIPVSGTERLLRFDPAFMDQHQFFTPLVKRANWLNLLGPLQLAALGGRDSVQSALTDAPKVTCHPLDTGMILQAGPAPAIGDVSRRDFLPAYRAVARVLRPIRVDSFGGAGKAFGVEAQDEWLNGFDRDYD
ncbi:DUF3396 domain-containing protein [Sulfidibacter corallicola]|uniref:DUF3396 domain-containing protein n=1 Tax=Sulfidibacter corallicola TaxID=2818388 RepID=A0A8A4TQG1_SULCO|nr:type VI immunity family protein [Sulfidibacter corallicola]QTD48785.1 DUF3396 domain-containing protein [Sulfidibacter corallicola]